MKVSELKEKLEKLDPDARVIVKGYEGGYNEAESAMALHVGLNPDTAWYYGKYDVAEAAIEPFEVAVFVG